MAVEEGPLAYYLSSIYSVSTHHFEVSHNDEKGHEPKIVCRTPPKHDLSWIAT